MVTHASSQWRPPKSLPMQLRLQGYRRHTRRHLILMLVAFAGCLPWLLTFGRQPTDVLVILYLLCAVAGVFEFEMFRLAWQALNVCEISIARSAEYARDTEAIAQRRRANPLWNGLDVYCVGTDGTARDAFGELESYSQFLAAKR